MPAPTVSYMICTGALIILIFAAQVFCLYVVDNVWAEMAKRELKEITDYVSDTIANLYFLANSTNLDVTMEKILSLPSQIGGSGYSVEILRDASDFAQRVKGFFKGKSWINVVSWLPPGLRVNVARYEMVDSGGRLAVVGCSRVSSNVYVWIAYKA